MLQTIPFGADEPTARIRVRYQAGPFAAPIYATHFQSRDDATRPSRPRPDAGTAVVGRAGQVEESAPVIVVEAVRTATEVRKAVAHAEADVLAQIAIRDHPHVLSGTAIDRHQPAVLVQDMPLDAQVVAPINV